MVNTSVEKTALSAMLHVPNPSWNLDHVTVTGAVRAEDLDETFSQKQNDKVNDNLI